MEVDERDGPSVVTLLGEHDMATVDELADRVDALFAKRRQVVVDLTRVAFMDSSVIALLLRWTREAQLSTEAFAVVLGPPKGIGARTMAIIGAIEYMPCFSTRELALGALAEGMKPRPERKLDRLTDPQLEAARVDALDESATGETAALRDRAARRLVAILHEQQHRGRDHDG